MGRGAEVKGAGIGLGPGECAKTRLSVKSQLGGEANIAGWFDAIIAAEGVRN